MKVISIPSSGKVGQVVSYRSRFGQVHRQYCIPANTQSSARQKMRGAFGGFAPAWGRVLTQAQREAWDVAGAKVQSKKRLGSGPLTGQQLFQGLNSARACIGRRGLMVLPPEPVVFGPNPVGQLYITNGANGARLLLSVTGPVTEDIMVFGQAPCSAGRMKRRNVAYLGLPPAPQDGMIDITDLYVARYGEPRPGEKVFIVTVQQQNGWEGDEKETSEIVPDKPAGQQAAATPALTLFVHMHKGCTRDAQGTGTLPIPGLQASNEPAAPSRQGGKAELDAGQGGDQSPIAEGKSGRRAAVGGSGVAGAGSGSPD